MIVFGGRTNDLADDKPPSRISETTIITFSELVPLYLAMHM